MTAEQLLSIPPAQLAAMSDEQLGTLLDPLIPLARRPFDGPRTSPSDGGKHSLTRSVKSSQADLARMMRQVQAAVAAQTGTHQKLS